MYNDYAPSQIFQAPAGPGSRRGSAFFGGSQMAPPMPEGPLGYLPSDEQIAADIRAIVFNVHSFFWLSTLA